MTGTPFGAGFSDLDAAEDPDGLLTYLERVAAIPVVRAIKSATTRALALAPGERVLDVGCGTGIDLAEMLEQTLPSGRVVGIDSSAQAIRVAAERASAADGITVQVADVYSLPFPDESFDA